ncbi:MAG: glycerol dehydrogenase [Bryobacterales bacterium]|nr:glycerol dehydrogenase [Bryobacterales bacterium]
MLSVFSAPSRYTQGVDATKSLGAEMTRIGLQGPALVLAGRSAAAQLGPVWRQTFGDSDIAYGVEAFSGECSHREIERVKAVAAAAKAEVIVGAGGGKVLDTARAVAAELDLSVVNCPTVASSDAPCSALSVLYDEQGVVVDYRVYGRNPDLVLVDTRVIANAPPRLLAAGMGDALATVFEARTCVEGRVKNMRGGASTQSALALAELCYRTLLEDGRTAMDAATNRAVSPALERLVEANTLLSGLGFESSGLAAAHSVHNGLTAAGGTHPYYHGEKVAFGTLVQLVLEGKPTSLIQEVLSFSTSVGLPITLADVGLPSCGDEDLERISRRSVAPGETIHNEPFEVSSGAVRDAIVAADAIGKRWKLEQNS